MDYYSADDEKKKKPIIDIAIILAIAIVVFFLIRLFFIPIKITDNSMQPNIQIDKYAFVCKIGKIKIGDQIAYKLPKNKKIKRIGRIIAQEGDAVSVSNKQIFINGTPLAINWPIKQEDSRIFSADFSGRDNMEEMVIAEKSFFIISDNLDFGYDSRDFGVVKKKDIIGKISFSY